MRDTQFKAIAAHIEEVFGPSVSHIFFESQKNASRSVFENFHRIPGLKQATKLSLVKRFGAEFFNSFALALGMCHSETLKYIPGEVGVARIDTPFYMPTMAAYIVGAFEFLEGISFDASWVELEPDSYMISINPASRESHIAHRLEIRMEDALGDPKELEQCPKCHAPKALRHWEWDLDKGILTDPKTNTRLVVVEGYAFNAMFREMALELGKEVYSVLLDAQHKWTKEFLRSQGLGNTDTPTEKDKAYAYNSFAALMPLTGFGRPTLFKPGAGSLEAVIENPFNPYIIGGTLMGMYELLEGRECKLEWSESSPNIAHFLVTPTS